jgi:hypothetical protein
MISYADLIVVGLGKAKCTCDHERLLPIGHYCRVHACGFHVLLNLRFPSEHDQRVNFSNTSMLPRVVYKINRNEPSELHTCLLSVPEPPYAGSKAYHTLFLQKVANIR